MTKILANQLSTELLQRISRDLIPSTQFGPSRAFLRLALTLPAPEPDEEVFADFFHQIWTTSGTQFMNS